MEPALSLKENAVSQKFIEIENMLSGFIGEVKMTMDNLHHDS